MSYATKGPGSDVTVYFHRMGGMICEGCARTQGKGAMLYHLEKQHSDKGDKVPESLVQRLRRELHESLGVR